MAWSTLEWFLFCRDNWLYLQRKHSQIHRKAKSVSTLNKAYQYRLYPNRAQRELFAKTFGCCRKVYNLMLADKKKHYEQTGKSITVTPAQYKNAYPFLREVDSLALANEQMHLQAAYQNFFRNKKIGFPKFKSKKFDKDSYTTNRVGNNIVVSDHGIKLPKLGVVKAKIHRFAPKDYVLKAVTVTLTGAGTYYASVLYEYQDTVTLSEVVTHIGLDYKSDGLYVASDGTFAQMPKFYRRSQKRLAKAQRRLSKKQLGSNNYRKQKQKTAKIARHIANQRKDFLHKLSAEITNQYDLISVEDLNLRSMATPTEKLHLGKATLDNGYGMFLSMLEYKQREKGHFLIKVDRFFPSSQLCQCGHKNPEAKDMSVRTITCPVCGKTYDRDINAAININNEGLRILSAS